MKITKSITILLFTLMLILPLAYAQTRFVTANETFDNGLNWTLQGGCAISGGSLNCVGGSARYNNKFGNITGQNDNISIEFTIAITTIEDGGGNIGLIMNRNASQTTGTPSNNNIIFRDSGGGDIDYSPDGGAGNTWTGVKEDGTAHDLRILILNNLTVQTFVNQSLVQSIIMPSGMNGNYTFIQFGFNGQDSDFSLDNFSVYNISTEAAAPPDVDPPTFGADSINDSFIQINEDITVSIVAIDETELGFVTFAHNLSGTLTNITINTASGTSSNESFIFTNTQARGHEVGYQFTINDSFANTVQTSIFTYEVQNTPPPDLSILFPSPDGLITFLQPLDLNVTFPSDADFDTLTIFYYIDGVLNQTSLTNTTFNASDGTFILNVSIFDDVEHSANQTIMFTIDTLNPIITITEPINNSLHGQDILVDLQCTNINIQNVTYIFHNESNSSIQTEVNATQDITLSTLDIPILISGLGDSQYNLNVTCTDNASLSASQFLFLNLDQTVPSLQTTLNNNTPEILTNVQINSSCSDVNGVSLTSFQNNASGTQTNITTLIPLNVTPFTYIFNHTAVNGTIAHVVTCEDAVGNSIQSAEIIYTALPQGIDTEPPIIDSTAISNTEPQATVDIIQINVTCSDIFTGLANVFVANNQSATLTNVSTISFDNVTTGTAEFNHTAVFGVIAHQFTCSDGVGNQAQSSAVLYNSSAAPEEEERQTTQLITNFLVVALSIGVIIALLIVPFIRRVKEGKLFK